MKSLHGTYVHRGDAERRRRRRRRILLLAGVGAALIAAVENRQPVEALAGQSVSPAVDSAPQVHAASGAPSPFVALDRQELDRWNRVFTYSQQYGVSPDLAGAIYDASTGEGIEPELAFRVVRVESEFNEHARSRVGAVGLTQLMLPTARFFDSTMTQERLYDRDANLHIGFRYLRSLIRQYGDVQLALLVYNRGPLRVDSLREAGLNPSNGYERMVMRGYRGTGVVN